MIAFLFLSPQIQDGDNYVKSVPPPSENHLHAIIIMLLKLFFRAMESRIYFHHQFFEYNVLISTKSNMAAILVRSFSAGATIKRCPTAFSYGNIDIDLSNLQNIICQKSLIKNSNMSHFLI